MSALEVQDESSAAEVAYKTETGPPVTYREVAEVQHALFTKVQKLGRQLTKSNNPGRRAAGVDLLELLGRS